MTAWNFSERIEALRSQTLLRRRRTAGSPCGPEAVIDGRKLLSFCSNDYLGLAAHPDLIAAAQAGAAEYGVGSGASHLISGHQTPHHVLEQRLAEFVGLPRALYFSTGYMANLGVIPALVGAGDALFSDSLNHASLIDAARLSRADIRRYPHCDLAALERELRDSPATRKLVISDAVFSMDGDIAPLPEMLALCRRYDAWLMADDAHGFGVLGPQGRGTLAQFDLRDERIVYMATLGKAAGVAGAFVAGSDEVIEWLVQRARTYIFTTASPALLAQALLTSLDLIERGDARRSHLASLIAQLHASLKLERWRLLPSHTAIQPLIIGENAEAMRIGEALLAQGLWVPAIRPPTVPAGSARLRITLSAAHSEAHVERLTRALMDLQG